MTHADADAAADGAGRAYWFLDTLALGCHRNSLVNPRLAAVDDQQIGTVTGKQPAHDLRRKLRAMPVTVADD